MDHEIRDRRRVAVPALSGYIYQVRRTLQAWLELAGDVTLVAEGNEDIDYVGRVVGTVEEQIKFRSDPITQGDEAITLTILRYVDAFKHHHSAGRSFKGVLRTNAEIRADDTTPIGKWILGRRGAKPELFAAIRALVKADENRRLPALRYITKSPAIENAFFASMEWCPLDGSLDEVEEKIAALIARRAPGAPPQAARNALLARMLEVLTRNNVDDRRLRSLDADLTINDAILDALQQSAATELQTARMVLWSTQGPPSVAAALAIDDTSSIAAAWDRQRRIDAVSQVARAPNEHLHAVVRAVDFILYVSIVRSPGPRGRHVCINDVIRQAARRHTPQEVGSADGPDFWPMKWFERKKLWPIPTKVDEHDPAVVLLAAIGASLAPSTPDPEMVAALGSKLRWAHVIDAKQYFTAERPLGAP